MLSFLRSLPPLVRAGFVIVLLGGVVDTTYHLAPHRTGGGRTDYALHCVVRRERRTRGHA